MEYVSNMPSKIVIKRPKREIINSETFMSNFEEFVGYWRANPHRFITEYLGIDLYGFQNPVIYAMDKYSYFIYAASRGLAKSTITLFFAIGRAILYPNQKIVVVSYEKGQSRMFIKKIEEFKNEYPNLNNEIEPDGVKTGQNESSIKFKNGSEIIAMTLSEGSRGARCHILIADEFALFKNREIISSIFTPMMTNTRKPPYRKLSKQERSLLIEPNKELYLSSIRTEMDWSWQYFLQILSFIGNGDKKYFAMALPYHYGVKHGYITPENVAKQFRENPENPALLRAEYEAIPIRSDGKSFFKYELFTNARVSTDVLIPMTDEEFVSFKDRRDKWTFYKQKFKNEIRIMSVDVALIGGKENDNTAINIFRLLPNGDKFKKTLSYCETINGGHSKKQALRIKQLFYEFECDWLAIDANGNGISLVDYLMDITEDPNRGVSYPAWTTANPEDLKTDARSLYEDAVPVMYAVKNSKVDNHVMYTGAHRMMEAAEVDLPVTMQEAINIFNVRYRLYEINDVDLKKRILSTFAQVNILIIETIELETVPSSGFIVLKEKGGKRKDRFSSWIYGMWLVSKLEKQYYMDLQSVDSGFEEYQLFY